MFSLNYKIDKLTSLKFYMLTEKAPEDEVVTIKERTYYKSKLFEVIIDNKVCKAEAREDSKGRWHRMAGMILHMLY